MPELCHNCGAELFAGQQYCRRCGVSVGAVPPRGEAPTQLFTQGPEATAAPAGGATTGAAHVATAPLGAGQHTELFAGGQPTSRQPPLAAFQQTSQLAPPAPPRRKGRGWLVVLVLFAVVILCGAAAVIAFIAGSNSGAAFEPRKVVVVKNKGAGERPAGVPAPPAPPIPADLPERIKEAIGRAGVPLPIDEAGASVTGGETVINKTFAVGGGATVSLRGAAGDVSIVGTDGPEVEVKITKRGGSAQERRDLPVLYSKTDEGLSLITAAPPGGRLSVSYEIKLPRELRRLQISSEAGAVKVRDFGGELEVELKSGDIEVAAEGPVRTKLMNGTTKVTYEGRPEGAQEFSVVNGGVEVEFADGSEATIRAETVNGDIRTEGDIDALVPEKRGAGRRLEAQLGGGGGRLAAKVVNGDIKLTQ